MEDVCRVCRISRLPDRPLFHPCRCTGSIKYVHQDCLMQWLGHSGKEYCEVCGHKFQFASVFRHDMPNWIPLRDIYQMIMTSVVSRCGRWSHFGLVIFIWLFFVPIVTYRIYKCIIYSSMWSLVVLPIKIFSIENVVLDSLFGIVVVVLCVIGFISLVWLKDQLQTGEAPQWLVEDRNNAKADIEEYERRKFNRNSDAQSDFAGYIRSCQNLVEYQCLSSDNHELEHAVCSELLKVQSHCLQMDFENFCKLRIEEIKLHQDFGLPLIYCLPFKYTAGKKELRGIEEWKTQLFDILISKDEIEGVKGMPSIFVNTVEESSFPSSDDLGLTDEQNAVLDFLCKPPICEFDDEIMFDDLSCVQGDLKRNTECYLMSQQRAIRTLCFQNAEQMQEPCLKSFKLRVNAYEENMEKEMNFFETTNKVAREKFYNAFDQVDSWYNLLFEQPNSTHDLLIREENEQQQIQAQNEEQVHAMRRPNIGEALVGLAREPQDGNAEAMQADHLMHIVGLDGSYKFLEHVVWLIILVSMILMVFVYVPSVIGSTVARILSLWNQLGIENWIILSSVLLGYCILFAVVAASYYFASICSIHRVKPTLGVIYLAMKICFLLFLEAGIFPLLCGWWIDICGFKVLGSNVKLREESLNSAPGTVMFLHWLAGMIFVFYFASLVVLLREVWRPGVLWFLRNLNDQNFHPVQDMMVQPLQRHIRRFVMSNIMFGISVMLVILVPSLIIGYFLPGFLPFNLTLISLVSPIREIQLELILLQFVIPTLLEHSNVRMAFKRLIAHWSTFTAHVLGLTSYLLDKPQSGGHVVDLHGNSIQYIEYESNFQGPVYVGEEQTLGPGYAPFKPYLRPNHFYIKITFLMVAVVITILMSSTFILLVPILIGRGLMLAIGISSPPDVYTASIGIYFLWICGKVLSPLVSGCSRGVINTCIDSVTFWIRQGLKCTMAGIFLFVVIPILLGHLVNLLIISPFRVPLHKTPLFYFTTEWALGLLHMKCMCGIIWLTDTSLKRTLEIFYQDGARNLRLTFVINHVLPIMCNLILSLAVPYVFFLGVLNFTGAFSIANCFLMYRYCYPTVLMLLILSVVMMIIVKQTHNLYTGIRNEKYLIGRQIVNFGSPTSHEISFLSSPVEESMERDQ